MSTITVTPQDVQFELVRGGSFNEMDGPAVADSLMEARGLWRGFLFDRAAHFSLRGYEAGECDPIDDIRLRDIEDGYWNADTLYILPADGRDDDLEALARTWNADEISWQNGPNAGRYLRVWWD